METIYDDAVDFVASNILVIHNKDIAIRGSKQVGDYPPYCHIFDFREKFLSVEHLDAVIGIPVAGNHHATAVQFYSTA